PNEVACEFGDVSISYAKLDSLSDTVAADLEGREVGPGHRVGILLRRSDKLVIGILGTLKAGAAYVPLDPEFPVERRKFIVDDADLSLVLTDSNLPNDAAEKDKLVDIADVLAGDAVHAAPAAPPRPEDSAYLIYTSGS